MRRILPKLKPDKELSLLKTKKAEMSASLNNDKAEIEKNNKEKALIGDDISKGKKELKELTDLINNAKKDLEKGKEKLAKFKAELKTKNNEVKEAQGQLAEIADNKVNLLKDSETLIKEGNKTFNDLREQNQSILDGLSKNIEDKADEFKKVNRYILTKKEEYAVLDDDNQRLGEENKELKVRIEIKNRELVKNEKLIDSTTVQREKIEEELNELGVKQEDKIIEIRKLETEEEKAQIKLKEVEGQVALEQKDRFKFAKDKEALRLRTIFIKDKFEKAGEKFN